MNGELRDLVRRYLEDGEYFECTRQILRMNPTGDDFSDELLDSFNQELRLRIVPLLPVWCEGHAREIVERRLKSETDPECLDRLEVLLSALSASRSGRR